MVETCPYHTDLVYCQCIAVSEGNCTQGLRLPWLSCSNVYLCPSSSVSIQRPHLQRPSGEDFLRYVYWNALPPPGCRYGELDLKTFFLLHSDSVFSTSFMLSLPPAPLSQAPWPIKLQETFLGAPLTSRQFPHVHWSTWSLTSTIPRGKLEGGMGKSWCFLGFDLF